MSEPEQSSTRDLADTASSLAGLGQGPTVEPQQPVTDAPLGDHGGSLEQTLDAAVTGGDAQAVHAPDGEAPHSESSAQLRPSSATQRGLPAVQPALASLLPPVAPQLHRGRLSGPELTAPSPLDAEPDDERPTNVPPRPDGDDTAAAQVAAEPEPSEPPPRAPIVPPVGDPRAALPVPSDPNPRAGSRPKPVPAPPNFPPFAQALWSAGLLAELRAESLGGLPRLDEPPSPRQRLDFLEAYYAAGTDPVVSLRRRATDRWFLYDASQPLLGPQLVQRLTFVLPELAQAHLERVGGKHGTLLLRAGEHLCALDDDQSERNHPYIAVSEIVRGMNMLMERRGERVRLVGLVGDGAREAYLGVDSLTLALALAGKELLTARDTETLMHLTGW
jgi:hypothetical protein